MDTNDVSSNHSRELRSPSYFKQLDARYNVGKRSSIEQQEIQEEYDNSHNPLFTVPSVPNLMDMHTSALQELTTILNTTIQHNGSEKSTAVNMNPLPKVMYQRQMIDDNDYNVDDESTSRSDSVRNSARLPGGWPESRQEEVDLSYTDMPINEQQTQIVQSESSGPSKGFAWFSNNDSNAETSGIDAKDTAKAFLMKSLSALVGVARMLGFTGQQISDMVVQIVEQQDSTSIPQEETITKEQGANEQNE